MHSHFDCIGVILEAPDEQSGRPSDSFVLFVDRLYKEGRRLAAEPAEPDGGYWQWELGEGVEVWGQMGPKKHFWGLNPFFNRGAESRVGLTARVPVENGSALDGFFHGWASPEDHNPEAGEFPFVFECPEAALWSGLQLPTTRQVRLGGFAREAHFFPNADALNEWQDRERSGRMAEQSFIPAGLFGNDAPQPLGLLTGIVREAGELRNAVTGVTFAWARVGTYALVLDLAFDRRMVAGIPQPGHFVTGVFWLTGRIVGEPPPRAAQKKSVWARLFGR